VIEEQEESKPESGSIPIESSNKNFTRNTNISSDVYTQNAELFEELDHLKFQLKYVLKSFSQQRKSIS